ncbi:MAG: hypothetical protein K8T20_14695 [Planctomycetes bacterium]|nr:hypothetical protein [Planctomycetota bacterium]
MKRLLLLLLAAALPASADDLEAKRAEAAKLLGRAWELRGKSDDEAKEVAAKVAEAIKDLYPGLSAADALVLRVPKDAPDADRLNALAVIEKRLAACHLKDARVVSHEPTTVYVLVGAAEARKLGPHGLTTLGCSGKFEFRLEATEDEVKELEKTGAPPKGTVALKMRGKTEKFLAKAEISLDSGDIAEMETSKDFDGHPTILMNLTSAGSPKLKKLTSENLNKRVAIAFGGEVLTAPTIMAPMTDRLQITGKYEQAELDLMVATFKSGTLAWPLVEVGPADDAPCKVEPVETYMDRLSRTHLMHAVLEDVLRERDERLYRDILKMITPRSDVK